MTEAAEAAAFGPTFVKPCPLLGADSVLVCVSQLPTAIRRCPVRPSRLVFGFHPGFNPKRL